MKEELIVADGLVIEVLPNNTFRVQLEDVDHTLLAYMSGKMRQNKIKIVEGDRDRIELSPYDNTKGRVSYRHK
jgi:translation initiation factor IF-1